MFFHALLAFGETPQRVVVIERQHIAVVDDLLAVDVDVLDGSLATCEDEAPQRFTSRLDRPVVQIDHHEVCLRPRGETSDQTFELWRGADSFTIPRECLFMQQLRVPRCTLRNTAGELVRQEYPFSDSPAYSWPPHHGMSQQSIHGSLSFGAIITI